MEGSVVLVSLCCFFAHICSRPSLLLITDRVPRQTGQGVIKTPCRFYFGCYIDTLCGRTLRNRMSGAAARHFFFLEKVRTVSACIGINLPLKKRPADGGEQPTPPWAALAQASRKCTFAQLAEDTPVPYAACWRKNLRLYASGRRKMWMRTRKNTICTSY